MVMRAQAVRREDCRANPWQRPATVKFDESRAALRRSGTAWSTRRSYSNGSEEEGEEEGREEEEVIFFIRAS
jgi:hypothetical protein